MSEPKLEIPEGLTDSGQVRLPLERKRRPRGLYIIPLITVISGSFLIFQHLRVFGAALTSGTGPTTFSSAYLFNAFGEILLALTALLGGLMLFFGVRIGWWLTALYLPWAWSRAVAIPLCLSSGAIAPNTLDSQAVQTCFFSLMFLYLFKRTVIEFCGMPQLPRAWVGFALAACGASIAYLLHPFAGPFSFSNEIPIPL